MKIIIIRHGDPDYANDTLTEKGWKEAEFLSEIISKEKVKTFYVSPLGRARDTASCTLKKVGREAVVKPWLKEFDAPIIKPNKPEKPSITWDWLPQDWMKEDKYFSIDTWYDTDELKAGNVKKIYDWVTDGLDELLSDHGYVRCGRFYEAKEPNNDTIVLFCHFGVECVILSHLLNVSPMLLWHGVVAAPSSFTTVRTEERRQGIASMRMSSFGEQTHLYMHNEEPSFQARFRECYFNENERMD